jgi:hypothetical protein
MKPISVLSAHVYIIGDARSSIPVDMSENGLDFELKGRQLNPRGTVRGWTFWECPDPSGCTHDFMRFSVRDTTGIDGSYPCTITPNLKSAADEISAGYFRVMPGRSDLSNAHPIFRSECCP